MMDIPMNDVLSDEVEASGSTDNELGGPNRDAADQIKVIQNSHFVDYTTVIEPLFDRVTIVAADVFFRH